MSGPQDIFHDFEARIHLGVKVKQQAANPREVTQTAIKLIILIFPSRDSRCATEYQSANCAPRESEQCRNRPAPILLCCPEIHVAECCKSNHRAKHPNENCAFATFRSFGFRIPCRQLICQRYQFFFKKIIISALKILVVILYSFNNSRYLCNIGFSSPCSLSMYAIH